MLHMRIPRQSTVSPMFFWRFASIHPPPFFVWLLLSHSRGTSRAIRMVDRRYLENHLTSSRCICSKGTGNLVREQAPSFCTALTTFFRVTPEDLAIVVATISESFAVGVPC